MADTLDLWLDGRFAGKLMRGETDHVEFLYAEDYLERPNPTPVSATMPTTQTRRVTPAAFEVAGPPLRARLGRLASASVARDGAEDERVVR